MSVLMSWVSCRGAGTGVQGLRDEGAGVGPYSEPLGLVAATKEEALRGHRHEGSTAALREASPLSPALARAHHPQAPGEGVDPR